MRRIQTTAAGCGSKVEGVKVFQDQSLSFCPQTERPRRAENNLQPSGRRKSRQDSSAWSPSSRRPWRTGSSSTRCPTPYSRCLSLGSGTPPCRHMVRPPRPQRLWARTVPLCSEGGGGSDHRRPSSHMFPSACCRCIPEDSSALCQRSRPPLPAGSSPTLPWAACSRSSLKRSCSYRHI